MNAKNAAKFKKPEEYQAEQVRQPQEGVKVGREVFFRLRLMPASLVQYAVEQVTLENDAVVERKNVTERDILPITLSKIEDLILQQVRR
jgi:hypothetical protein